MKAKSKQFYLRAKLLLMLMLGALEKVEVTGLKELRANVFREIETK